MTTITMDILNKGYVWYLKLVYDEFILQWTTKLEHR